MPGFMGLRGLEIKTQRDMERERREEPRPSRTELERRSREKVREILRNQEGDMSEYNGHIDDSLLGECEKISRTKVADIMTGRVAVLSFDDTLLTVQGVFSCVKFRHLPVVDEDGCIIGIISDRDVLRLTSPFYGTINEQNRDKEIMSRKVGTVMTRHPVCISPAAVILDAVQLMNHKKISCLPVVETYQTGTLLGIITWKDVVRAYCPAGFSSARDSSRLKTSVRLSPACSEDARTDARAAESARIRAAAKHETDVLPAAAPAHDSVSADQSLQPDSSRFHSADLARLKNASGRTAGGGEDPCSEGPPSDSAILRSKISEGLRTAESTER